MHKILTLHKHPHRKLFVFFSKEHTMNKQGWQPIREDVLDI